MSQVTLELPQLLEGRSFSRGSTTFPNASTIVNPFVEKVDEHVKEWRITAKMPSEIAVDVNEEHGIEKHTEYNIYPRVAVEGILNDEYQINVGGENHIKTVGLIYGLDTRNPIAKVYTGYLRELCMNLSVFNPSNLQSVNFDDPHFERLYNYLPGFISEAEEDAANYENIYNELVNQQYEGEALQQLLGHLALKAYARGLTSAFTTMIGFIHSPKNKGKVANHYYKRSGEYSKWDLYNMLNAPLSTTDSGTVFQRPRKVLEAYKMMSA